MCEFLEPVFCSDAPSHPRSAGLLVFGVVAMIAALTACRKIVRINIAPIDYLPSITSLAIDREMCTTIYAGTGKGAFKSTDGGVRWTSMNTGLTDKGVIALAIDPSNTTTIYAGTPNGVFKSLDGAGDWTAINAGLARYCVVNALAIDPSRPATLYAGTDVGGVFKSTNGGGRWKATNFGLRKFAQELGGEGVVMTNGDT